MSVCEKCGAEFDSSTGGYLNFIDEKTVWHHMPLCMVCVSKIRIGRCRLVTEE